mgnify:CR=1 FL=1
MSDQFADLGVPADVVGTLHARGIESAFPIQAMTIPDALAVGVGSAALPATGPPAAALTEPL